MRRYDELLRHILVRIRKHPKRVIEDPPSWLCEQVRVFRVQRPDACAADWEDFAQGVARQAYAFGWLRAMEHKFAKERHEELKPPPVITVRDNEYWRRAFDLGYDPRDGLATCTPEERLAFEEALASQWGHYKWVR